VVDNLERAAASASAAASSPEATAIAEGVELSLKLFVDTLTRFDVQPIDPVGQPFDPQFHQAMSMVENANMEPNSVMAVLQKGYSLHGRLVRPAMVVVSRAAAPRVDERA
jgi:molecular chaperone GrpE